MINEVLIKAQKAKEASFKMALVPTPLKNDALIKIADILEKEKQFIIHANTKDLKYGEKKGLSKALLDRLALNEKRILAMAEGLKIIKDLPDPIGEVISSWTRPNGISISKVCVPFGVIGIIYEARPNVTIDAVGLCLKTSNVVILRGGSDAINSNKALVYLIKKVLKEIGIPENAVVLIEDTNRSSVIKLMRLKQYIDVLIPRGGAGLIKNVVENSIIPVIETGTGNCHVYVEETADLQKAVEIVINAKCQRPSVCNAAETLLVDEKIAYQLLHLVIPKLESVGVEIRACDKTRKLITHLKKAVEKDWYTEYLDLIIACKVVKNINEAIEHINKYGSKHTEAIITENLEKANKFTQEIDAAAVMVNTTTRFTDGFEFGFGAEIGISTQKLHARGPMGLPELTTYKYVVRGNGQIRR